MIDAVTQGFGEGGILGAINGLLTGLTAAWPAIVEWFAMAGTTIAAQLMTWGQAFVDWITPYISIALTYLGQFISAVWAWISEQAPAIAAQVLACLRAMKSDEFAQKHLKRARCLGKNL